MLRPFFLLMLTGSLIACNNDSAPEDALLSAAPYDALTDSIDRDPKNPEHYYNRGYLLYKNGQVPYAVQDLRTAWDLAPQARYAVNLGVVLQQRHPDSAIAFLEAAARKLPSSIDVKLELARAYREKGANDKALQLTTEILAQSPNAIDAYDLQSEIQRTSGRESEALTALEKAYGLSPNDEQVVEKLAFAYADAGNPKALPLLDSIIRVGGARTGPVPYYLKGLYFENTGRSDEALRLFDQAIVADHRFLDAYMDKGQVLLEVKKDAKKAASVFRQASDIDPKYPEAYLWLGKSQEALGDRKAAYDNYVNAANLDPEMKEAKEGMARTRS